MWPDKGKRATFQNLVMHGWLNLEPTLDDFYFGVSGLSECGFKPSWGEVCQWKGWKMGWLSSICIHLRGVREVSFLEVVLVVKTGGHMYFLGIRTVSARLKAILPRE